MSFVPAKRPIVSFPITAQIYGEDGKLKPIDFVLQYNRVKRKELADLSDSVVNFARKNAGQEPIKRADGSSIPEWKYTTDEQFVLEHACGWVGVQNDAGEAIAFASEALADVLSDYPELVTAAFNGFFNAHQGAREKN